MGNLSGLVVVRRSECALIGASVADIHGGLVESGQVLGSESLIDLEHAVEGHLPHCEPVEEVHC